MTMYKKLKKTHQVVYLYMLAGHCEKIYKYK